MDKLVRFQNGSVRNYESNLEQKLILLVPNPVLEPLKKKIDENQGETYRFHICDWVLPKRIWYETSRFLPVAS